MQDKEQAYNEHIAPLAEQIHKLAMEHGIPLHLAAQTSEDSICGCVWLPPEAARVMHIAHAILEGRIQVTEIVGNPLLPAGKGGLQA